MASVNCECSDCQNKFSVNYVFFKPDKLKCPACGSCQVKEESARGGGCDCSKAADKPVRFT